MFTDIIQCELGCHLVSESTQMRSIKKDEIAASCTQVEFKVLPPKRNVNYELDYIFTLPALKGF